MNDKVIYEEVHSKNSRIKRASILTDIFAESATDKANYNSSSQSFSDLSVDPAKQKANDKDRVMLTILNAIITYKYLADVRFRKSSLYSRFRFSENGKCVRI